MITRAKLRNWKSHKDTELELGEGTNVLVGIMGSGKSAVLDAVTYGLFGTVPAVRNRKITLDDLIRKRPVEEDSAEVEIEFVSPEGERYIVKRVLERENGTTFAELRKEDGTLIDKPRSTSVTEHVTSLLQIDYDFFRRMIYAEQNQLDRFLTLEPRKRREKIDELLKINRFEKARKNTTTLINRLKDREKDRRQDLKKLREDEEIKTLPSLEKELEDTRSEKADLVEKNRRIKPELEEVEKRLQKFEETKERIDELSKEIESVSGRIEALNQQVSRTEEKLGKEKEVSLESLKKRREDLEVSLQETKERVRKLDSEASSNTAKVSKLETKKGSLREKIGELEEKVGEKEESKEELEEIDFTKLRKEVDNLNERRESLRDDFSGLRVQVKNLRKSLEELQEAGTTCPVCGRPLAEKMKESLIQERRTSLKNSESQISKLEEEIEEVEKKISKKGERKERAKDLRRDMEDLPELESKLSDVRGEFEKKSRSLEDALEAEEEVCKTLEEAKQEVERIRKGYESVKKKMELQADLKSAKDERREAKGKEEKLKEKLQEKKEKFDEKLVEELREKHQGLIKKQEHFKTKISDIEKLIEQKGKLIESVREKKRTLNRREAEVGALKESTNSLNKVQKALSKSQTSIRKQVIEAVNGMMNEIWDEIYPYEDFRQIRLSIEERRKTSDYELQVMDSTGTWNPVEGVTSGGERTCASLTLRIAFAVVLAPSLSWLVLDEPTHNLDSEGISHLSKILREGVPKVVRQLLLITHEKRLESAVSACLYRFYRDKSRDGPTKVQRVYEEM